MARLSSCCNILTVVSSCASVARRRLLLHQREKKGRESQFKRGSLVAEEGGFTHEAGRCGAALRKQ